MNPLISPSDLESERHGNSGYGRKTAGLEDGLLRGMIQ